MPPRSSFDAQTLKAFLPHIFISEYEAATRRYRYRLIGTAITDYFRRNATGQYFDEIYSTPDLHDLRDMHDAARLAGEPKTISGKVAPCGRATMKAEALLLPVGVAAGQNPQLLGALYLSVHETAFTGKAGRIAPGMEADLVVLDGDPSRDIRALARVRYTLRQGRIIYRR